MNIKPADLTDVPVETIELTPIGRDGGRDAERKRTDLAWLWRWVASRKWYLCAVVGPTLLAGTYFGILAADRYEAEARFVVRTPSAAAASQITNLVQGSGIVRSTDDAYIVHAYIRSRDAVIKLAADNDLVARLTRPEADFIWSYPGFLRRPSAERLWRHFQDFITIDFDQTTGITTLKVQSFRPEDAREVAVALLANSETLINGMSERAQKEALDTATREVTQTRERAQLALDRITEFRRRNAMIDPGRVSTAALETITKLALEIASTNAELSELKRASPDSPRPMR